MRVTIEDVLNCTKWKTCSKCGDEKKLVMFSRMGEGYRPSCKDCDSKGYYRRKAKKALLVEQPKISLLKRVLSWVLG
jgi:hypothetical protein